MYLMSVFLYVSGLWRNIWEVFYYHPMSLLQRNLLQSGCVSKSVREQSLKNLFLLQKSVTEDGQETSMSHKPKSLSFDCTADRTIEMFETTRSLATKHRKSDQLVLILHLWWIYWPSPTISLISQITLVSHPWPYLLETLCSSRGPLTGCLWRQPPNCLSSLHNPSWAADSVTA